MKADDAHAVDNLDDTLARPDWDPYAVWQTRIKESASAHEDSAAAEHASDANWSPYSVWQTRIKDGV